MTKKIKWGIAGLGNIATKFAQDLTNVPEAQLVAVASSNMDRAQAFKQQFQAEKAYDSYDQLYRDPDVAVIYIASLNQNHKEMTLAALAAGKGVLCEKPLGLNPKEVESMIAAAKKYDCFLMEGLWSRFNLTLQRAKQYIDEGRIGTTKFLYAEFSFYRLEIPATHRLMDPEKGGGVLLDIGVYPLFLAYYILGKPLKILARSQFGNTGVDVQTSMLLEYENAQAILYCGIANESDNNAKIGGTQGEITLHGMWHNAQSISLTQNKIKTTDELPTTGNGFGPQIEEVNHCMSKGKKESALWTHKNALELANMVAQVALEIKRK
jgi:predicted dehydrogenase